MGFDDGFALVVVAFVEDGEDLTLGDAEDAAAVEEVLARGAAKASDLVGAVIGDLVAGAEAAVVVLVRVLVLGLSLSSLSFAFALVGLSSLSFGSSGNGARGGAGAGTGDLLW